MPACGQWLQSRRKVRVLVVLGQGLLTGTAGLGRHTGQCTVLTKRRFSVGWMVPARCRFPRLGNPLVSSVEFRRFVIRALGHSRLSRSYFPAPAFSHVVAGICHNTREYVLAVAAPALDRRALDTGPFCRIFSFFPQQAHLPCEAMPLRLRAAFSSAVCTCPPCPMCTPMAHCSSSPQKSCNAGRTLIAALRHSHNTLARRLLACTCTCNCFLADRPPALKSLTHSYSVAREITSSSSSPKI